jgi:hypothetical protein
MAQIVRMQNMVLKVLFIKIPFLLEIVFRIGFSEKLLERTKRILQTYAMIAQQGEANFGNSVGFFSGIWQSGRLVASVYPSGRRRRHVRTCLPGSDWSDKLPNTGFPVFRGLGRRLSPLSAGSHGLLASDPAPTLRYTRNRAPEFPRHPCDRTI